MDATLKKSIMDNSGSYTTGTSRELQSIIYRYDQDFSDEAIEEVIEFAKAVKDEQTEKILSWLLESRREVSAKKLNLGQMKIDIYRNCCLDSLVLNEQGDEAMIWREGDVVVISASGYDEEEERTWTASARYTVDEFLNMEEGSLESTIGEIMAHATVYDE